MHPGFYDHLNETDPPAIALTMEQLVSMVRTMNYGTHRFLSELLKQRRIEEGKPKTRGADPQYVIQNDMLERLLLDNFF